MVAPGDSKGKRKRAIRTVRSYLDRYRRGLVVGALCLVMTDLLLLANPWILKLAIDGLEGGIGHERLYQLAGLFVAVAAVSGVFRFFMRRIMIGISRKIELDIRADFFAHLQSLSPSFYDRRRTGDLMALATNDLTAVRMLVGPAVMYSLNTIVVGSLSIGLMVYLSWSLSVAALLPMAVLIFAMYHGIKVIHRLFERVQQRFASINSRAQENLSGIRVVKAYAREEHEVKVFEELSENYVDHNMKLFRVQSLLQPLLTTVAGLGALAILAFGGRLVITGEITLGTFVAFNGYLTMLVWPMIAVGWVMNIFQRGLASMERMNEVFEVEPDIIDPTAPAQPGEGDYAIRFENVSFRYGGENGRHWALRNVDFEIRSGETVAIVGATGSGKSTVIKLMLRLYDATEGRILVGGQPVREIRLSDLRSLIGLVPQDIFLFSDTIRENIGFGVPVLEDRVLYEVSQTAAVHDDIEEFPNGFQSMIGERGINLSGGQKQRVAIARALAKSPRILILDDALSSVDADTEDRILDSMRAEFEQRTAVVISHRISTAREADRILVLDDGELVEQGTHDELVALGGVYAEMNRRQQLMVAIEGQG
jgi:ATP-binding cassette subfamily B protein